MKVIHMKVIFFSGGIDSTVLVHWAKSNHYTFRSVSFDFGYPPQKAEKKFVDAVAKEIGFGHTTIDMHSMRESLKLPPFDTVENALRYNGLVEALIACSVVPDGDEYVLGTLKGEPELDEKTKKILWELGIGVVSPFSEMTKQEVIDFGSNMGVDFKTTWSCLLSGEIHCGFCGGCRSRKMGFSVSSVPDPTEYFYNWKISSKGFDGFVKNYLKPLNDLTNEYEPSLIVNYEKIVAEVNERFSSNMKP